jgi:hypothetical protein
LSVFFFKKLKEKKKFFLDEKGFCKKGFVLKIVSSMERRDKEKPSKHSKCCIKV